MTEYSHSLQNSSSINALPDMTQCSTRDSAGQSLGTSAIEQPYILGIESGAAVARPVQHVTLYECPFLFLGCEESFYDAEAWRSHAETHFGNHPPPTHAICCFCDWVFDNEDPNVCWGHRMNHVAAHHMQGDSLRRYQCRQDYALARYMYNIRSQSDHYQARTLSQASSVYGQGELVYGNQQPVQPAPGVGRQPEYVIHTDPRRGRRHRGGRLP
jgi:hypothetical protein